ncbi:MAG: glycosyltransferase family 2 protein [Firmicutes bacterium]|nr:glycosyltransferase family 2 protein [Bacillota bacterium]
MTVNSILIISIILGLISIFFVLHIFDHYRNVKRKAKKMAQIQDYITRRYVSKEKIEKKYPKNLFLEAYIDFSNTIELSTEIKYDVYKDMVSMGLVQKYLKALNSKNDIKRMRAITFLSTFQEKYIINTMLTHLGIESNERAKTLIAYSLKNRIDEITLPVILDSLVGSKRFYQYRVIHLLQQHMPKNISNIEIFFHRKEIEIKEVLVDLANAMYHPSFEKILLSERDKIEHVLSGGIEIEYQNVSEFRVQRLQYRILSALSTQYGYFFREPKYLLHSDEEIAKIAAMSLAKEKTLHSIEELLKASEFAISPDIYAHAILVILEHRQSYYDYLIEYAKTTDNLRIQAVLSHVFSHRIEYIIMKLQKKRSKDLSLIVSLMIENGSFIDIINFLNQNKDSSIENVVMSIIQPISVLNEPLLLDLNTYLSKDIYKRMGFHHFSVEKPKVKHSLNEVKKTRWLLKILFFSIFILPVIFFLTHLGFTVTSPLIETLKKYVVFVNLVFIFYYLTVNFVYFGLAILSYFSNKKQSTLWKLKSHPYLYESGMIPSVSIIAPAYNEELSIVENIHSLLNLDYPEYEVIVVNDGSKDRTLETVIHHFDLIRKDIDSYSNINTKSIRAVYKNKSFPNLTVIDKENGGKADALNVGINYAKNEYVCGIDADSILDSDALLRVMSSILDHDKITIALGGTIVPVNGSVIDRGHVEHYGLPKNRLARFQTIEYLRAFNISRLGFSELHSLLIISGAFGLFEKRILIESGGYLTVSSLKKDTVGEDMELVVRVTRRALETDLNYRVDFISKSKCYTEVPENTKSLFKQRNHWQRGLVDILSYHRHLIFNPKYKQVGLIAMPYFFIFEMVGPLFEVQAYAAIILGIVFGLLNAPILLGLMVVSILMGIVLSMLSLFISESEHETFSFKEILLLIFIGFVENFGWRQFISVYRVKGFIASLRENQAWGQMNRVGFNPQPQKNLDK